MMQCRYIVRGLGGPELFGDGRCRGRAFDSVGPLLLLGRRLGFGACLVSSVIEESVEVVDGQTSCLQSCSVEVCHDQIRGGIGRRCVFGLRASGVETFMRGFGGEVMLHSECHRCPRRKVQEALQPGFNFGNDSGGVWVGNEGNTLQDGCR